MQFHLNGFRPGDPEISEQAGPRDPGGFPDEVDVLIVGSGPTGLTLAAQLSAFPGINTRIVEQKPGRLLIGQAAARPGAGDFACLGQRGQVGVEPGRDRALAAVETGGAGRP